MDIYKAKEIVQLLANGIDPITGEVLPKDSSYNNPDIIRALFVILENTKSPKIKKSIAERQKDNLENDKPKNTGLQWTDALKEEVATLHSEGKSVNELAEHFERTKGAIRSELKHQGLVNVE